MGKNRKKGFQRKKVNHLTLSPFSINTVSLIIIVLFSLFVFETLSFAVKEGLQKGTRIAYNQYEEREKNLAKVGVLQLIKSIEYGRTQTVLDEEFYKSEIIRMMKNGTLGKDSKRGFFVFDDSNVCLISYDFPEMEGYALDDLPVEISTGSHLSEYFQTLRNGEITDGYFIHYYAGRSGTEKTSYIAYYPQWGWIVGAGYYGKDGEIFKKEQEALWGNFGKELNSRVMFRVLLFSLFIYSIILVITVLLKKSYTTQMRLNNDYELFRDTLEENLCVMITDAEGRIQRVNHRYRELTDTEGLQISGRFFDTYIHPDTRRETAISMKNTLGEKELWTGTIKGLSQDGREFWIQSQIKPLYGINGSLNGYIAVGLDMTELQTIKENLKKSAFIDSLTGCGNWEKLLHDYEKTDSAYIAYYNIDAFSSIYQFYGLESSEQILIHITEKFIKMLDSDESLYRIDFDTFVIMHRGKEKQLFITRSRDRLKTVNEQILNLKDLRYHISMRAGIAMGAETENLVLADIALENAKNSTEGIAVLDDKSIPDSMEKKSEIQKLHLIKDAMVNEGLYLVYQPILNISGNYIEKYECLIRMKTENGEVCPSEIIDLTKKGRLYKKITTFVIENACREFQYRNEDFSINLTLEDLSEQEAVSFLILNARKYQVSSRLIIEIVETEELRDFEGLSIIINRIKKEGIRIAIDDFGSGFSNFKYLLEVNADFIKIDGSLIQNLITDRRNRTLVQSIVEFAKCSEMKTIAEYVDNPDLLSILKSFQIDYGQGYYIGEPETELPSEQSEKPRFN